MDLKRGTIATAALPGDLGKPRPVLVVQADLFNETHATVTVLPITSTLVDAPHFRLTLEPARHNGLRKVSQVMVDKVTSLRRERIGDVIGTVTDEQLLRTTRALAVWLGIG